jgi:hypothetical protein
LTSIRGNLDTWPEPEPFARARAIALFRDRCISLGVPTAGIQQDQLAIAYIEERAQRVQETVASFVAAGGGRWEGSGA